MSLSRQIVLISIATVLIAVGIGYVTWQKRNEFIAREIEDFQENQLAFVSQVGQKVELSFSKLRDDLYALSQIPDVQFLSKNTCLLNMVRVQKLNNTQIDSIYRTDKHGNIRYAFPKTECPVTGDQLDKVFNYCRMTGKSLFRVIRTLNDGSDYLVITLPVYTVQGNVHLNPSNKFSGILFFTTPLKRLNKYFFATSNFGNRGYPWIITPQTLLISTANEMHLGRRFNEFLPDELPPDQQVGILTILEKMVKGGSGVGQYSYGLHQDVEDKFVKLTAYTPLQLPDQIWSIAVSNPLDDVLMPLEESIGELHFYSISLIGVMALLALLTIQLLRRNQSAQLEQLQRKEEENSRVRKEWQLTFDAVDSLVFLLDNTFSIIRANTAATAVIQSSSEEIIGRNLTTILQENSDSPVEIPSPVTAKKEDFISKKVSLLNPKKTYLMTLIPVQNIDQNVAYICYFKDISVIEELQENYHRAQKMESIGLMAGGVAHDLNNILSGIVSYPELILMKLPENSEFRRPLEMIQTSGHRAAAIVNDLLTIARGVASVKTGENLNELVESFMQSAEFKNLQKQHPGVQFRTELNPDLLHLRCSPVHVLKCLMNLCTNGAEAIDTEGQVVIGTKNYFSRGLNQNESGNRTSGDRVILTVTDTGKGISTEDREHIFEPFYTKKIMGKSGTGLGLAVVWNTMEDHEGYVDLISDQNGSSFILSFPAVGRQIKEIAPVEDIEQIMGDGERILIVDDEDLQRDIARQMLTTLGYHATSVKSGEEALLFLKDQSAELVLLDMVMDPGINGCETYEQILKTNPDQKAVIASGFSENVLVKRVLLLGAGALIRKPYTLKQIGSTVKSVLARKIERIPFSD